MSTNKDGGSFDVCAFCLRMLYLPFVGINVLYNLRMELLIIWAVYEIARQTTLAGNTRSASDRDLAASGSDTGDLECTDADTADADFEQYGLICIVIVSMMIASHLLYLVCKVWLYPYGSIGYIVEYVKARRSMTHKILIVLICITVTGMVIYGFIIASEEGAPLQRVVSPLLEGLYTCMVACYELTDKQPYTIFPSSQEVSQIVLPFPSAFVDIVSLYQELELAILAAKLSNDMKGLELMGLNDMEKALVLSDVAVSFDQRQVDWAEWNFRKAIIEGCCMDNCMNTNQDKKQRIQVDEATDVQMVRND